MGDAAAARLLRRCCSGAASRFLVWVRRISCEGQTGPGTDDAAPRTIATRYARTMSDRSSVAPDLPDVDLLLASGVLYADGLRWQHDRVAQLREGGRAGWREALALIEHAPVYTMGRRGGRASVRLDEADLRAPVVDVERGGDMTWHGPGQLVGYPILDLRARGLRVADYVRLLEGLLSDVLGTSGIEASTVAGRPGVWVGDAKVAAIGIAVRGGVAFHGFALNVAPDLAWYDAIVPCGLADARVTSMQELRPEAPSIAAVVEAVAIAFERRFTARLTTANASMLGASILGTSMRRRAVPA